MIKTKLSSRMAMLMVLLLSIPILSFAQGGKNTYTLSGKVTDGKEALIGVTVGLAGTASGTITDLDGAYTFTATVPDGDYSLVFSYVGFAQKNQTVTLAGGKAVTTDATMSTDGLGLSEVVVIGSTVSLEKKTLGNAVTTIRADQLTKTGSGDIIQSLQGKVPGAQITQNSGDPAGGISITLRGAKTLLQGGTTEPLYVIDGVISNNGTKSIAQSASSSAGDIGNSASVGQNRLADINPNDIEDITILNGAAAAAIYGSRAINGVVNITTKRGKSGKPQITFSTTYQVNELRKKLYTNLTPLQFEPTLDPANAAYLTPENTRLWPLSKGGATPFYNEKIAVKRYDYQDNVYRTGTGSDNNLSVSGGTEYTKYFMSLGFLTNQGIVNNSDFQRYSMRARVDQKINDWINVSGGLSYSISKSSDLPTGNSFYSPTNTINITNNIYDITARDAYGNLKGVEISRVNPLSVTETFKLPNTTNRTIADIQVNLTPISGLKISGVLGIDNTAQSATIFLPRAPYANVNAAFYNDGYAASNSGVTFLLNTDVNVNYATKFSKDISSSTTVGASYQYTKGETTLNEGRNLAPFVESVNGAATVVNQSYGLAQNIVSGAFLQQTVGISDRLFVTLAGRIDASTSFGADNATNFYPKASLSYLVSDEGFWKNSSLKTIVPQFKLRTSWGQAGGLTSIGFYDKYINTSTSPFVGVSAFNVAGALGNPNIKPERETELEVGADFSLFSDRISMNFSWYNQDITDLLLRKQLAASQGGTSVIANIGTMTNKGYELGINASIVRSKDFNWNVYGSLTHNANIVTSIPQAIITVDNGTGAPITILKDQPAGVFYGSFYATNPDGSLVLSPLSNVAVSTLGNVFPQQERGVQNVLDPTLYTVGARDANGQPTGAFLKKIIGNPNPDFIWSAGSNLTYQNWNFAFLFDALSGVSVFNADRRTRQGVGIGALSEEELLGTKPRGYINAIYPILAWRIDDGSFIKLRQVSLSYNFGSKVIKGVSNLNVALVGRNLLSFDNYVGYDPETNAGGQGALFRGVDFGNVPIPRTYQFKVTASF
jgi:TonB-linked SusC/RagA family outer membrane protein